MLRWALLTAVFLLSAWPALAADWTRVEVTFSIGQHPPEAVAKVLKARLKSWAIDPQVSWVEDRLKVEATISPDQKTEVFVREISAPGRIGFHRVTKRVADCGAVPETELCMRASDPDEGSYLLGPSEFDNDGIAHAEPGFGHNGFPVVNIRLTPAAARLFGEMTVQMAGRQIAISLDGTVLTAPTVQTPILGGELVIHGTFDVASTTALATYLLTSPLPGPISPVIVNASNAGPQSLIERLKGWFD